MFLRDTSAIADRAAIADGFDHKLTYGELAALGEDYRRDISERSLVLILCDYAIETVAFYYCQMVNHVVPILADKKSRPNLLSKIIKTYEPQFIWCPLEMEDIWQEVTTEKTREIRNHVLLKTSFGMCEMDSRLALLLTTSGTTGSVKFVRQSYDNILCNTQSFSEKIELRADDRGITTLPMHHCYGLSLLHLHWLAGALVYVTDCSVLDVRFWNLFQKGKITNFAGVPYTYEMLRQIGFLERDYAFLRFVTQSGAKMNDKLKKEFAGRLQKKNVRFYSFYGQTEATIFISCLLSKKTLDKLGSAGEPLAGIEISVENPDERGVGEFVLRGKTVSLGYAFCRKDLARGDDNGGCLHTGDIGYVDKDGDIFICGRKSRFVKLLGERVSLDELEQALVNRFPDTEFACAGSDDRICIYYVSSKSGKEIEKEILGVCRKEFSISGKLAECRNIEEIPHTGTGKVDYVRLQKLELPLDAFLERMQCMP